MNFSRSASGSSKLCGHRSSPFLNRFFAAFLATVAALMIATVGSTQWASADSGTTSPEPDPTPTLGAPRNVIAKPGDASAAVAWNKPLASHDAPTEITGYVVTAHPSGDIHESEADATLIIFEGLENGVEYTFTVLAFNGDGPGAESEPSNTVTPEAGLELDEEKLERLREHLRKLAREARERLEKAEERSRKQLEKHGDRIDKWLLMQKERAEKHIDKVTDEAQRQNEKNSEKARDWFERLKDQLAKKLERAEGTDRYDDLRDRAEEQLAKAELKLEDRLENSRRVTDARIEKAEEKVERRISRAEERAENSLQRVEQRLGDRLSEMRERLRELLIRLRTHWIERSGATS